MYLYSVLCTEYSQLLLSSLALPPPSLPNRLLQTALPATAIYLIRWSPSSLPDNLPFSSFPLPPLTPSALRMIRSRHFPLLQCGLYLIWCFLCSSCSTRPERKPASFPYAYFCDAAPTLGSKSPSFPAYGKKRSLLFTTAGCTAQRCTRPFASLLQSCPARSRRNVIERAPSTRLVPFQPTRNDSPRLSPATSLLAPRHVLLSSSSSNKLCCFYRVHLPPQNKRSCHPKKSKYKRNAPDPSPQNSFDTPPSFLPTRISTAAHAPHPPRGASCAAPACSL